MKAKIHHNVRCSESRQAPAVLHETSIEPEIIKCLDAPPTKDELCSLIRAAGLDVTGAVRTKEAELKELGLPKESNDKELLDAMVSYPRLTEHPFVVTNKGARMTRPTGVIEEVLQPMLIDPFGSPMLITKLRLNLSNNCCPTH